MPKDDGIQRETVDTLLSHLPANILFDLARNDSASREYRKAAVKFLLDGKFRQANDPELRELVREIKAEREAESEVISFIETATEQPVHVATHHGHGPFKASVTTKTMYDSLPEFHED